MKRYASLVAFVGFLLSFVGGVVRAQQPTLTPSPTPVIVTTTPVPQIVVVTATPSALSTPKTFWSEYGDNIIIAAISLVFGVVLAKFWEQISTQLGKATANWLGRLGSGWGFKKRYLGYLIEKYRVLNIRGMRAKNPVAVELEQIYVSLGAQAPDAAPGHEMRPVQSIGEAIAQNKRLAILGGPGTGKTTLLVYLTLTFARAEGRTRLGLRKKWLPIYLRLGQLKGVLEEKNGLSWLPEYLDRRYDKLGLRPRAGFFSRMLQRGRCLVLLDGLDEVAAEAERQRMSEWVDELVAVYADNQYVVTSRPASYESTLPGRGFTVLYIRDFASDEIRRFAENWCLAVEIAVQGADNRTARERAQQAANDLVAAIEVNDSIRRLAVNPLLLSIIALVHRSRTLPDRRVELYADCVGVLLEYWDKAKGLVSELSLGQKLSVLQPLALEMHRRGQQEIPRRELETLVSRLLPKVKGQEVTVAGFLEEVRDRSGLLVEQEIGQYAFSHLTFQEYLCARELVENERVRDQLLERVGDDWWRDVTLLYAGMTDATPLVNALLAIEDDENRSRLLLAGMCVTEAGRVDKETRDRVVCLLRDTFMACKGRLFLRIGEVLASIAGDDSVDFFMRIARDVPFRRVPSLLAVGSLGRGWSSQTPREYLLARLRSYYQREEWRQDAGIGLADSLGSRIDDLVLLDVLGRETDPTLVKELTHLLDWKVVTVPADEFLMGNNRRKVYVEAFVIDKYPVTNAQYKRFVQATGHRPPQHWKAGDYPAEKALHPVVCVSWRDAAAYAEWAGKRLPTEEEWEKAARGTDGREYPWGRWEDGHCNTVEAEVGETSAVGRYSPKGDSPYGCVDMAGNVWEWVDAWYAGTETRRVVRGGSWNNHRGGAHCSFRYWVGPDIALDYIGFRCAQPLP
jgi:hypothetical protein